MLTTDAEDRRRKGRAEVKQQREKGMESWTLIFFLIMVTILFTDFFVTIVAQTSLAIVTSKFT